MYDGSINIHWKMSGTCMYDTFIQCFQRPLAVTPQLPQARTVALEEASGW